jgi:site-specific recombinase XerD
MTQRQSLSLRVLVGSAGGEQQYGLFDRDRAVTQANAFLKTLEQRGLSRFTLRAYAYDLLRFYRWLEATDRKLLELSSADLTAFIASQRATGAAPRSINRRLSTVRLLYRFWTQREIATGPGALAPAPHYKGPGTDHHLGLHRLRRRAALALRVREPQLLIDPLSPRQVRSFLRSLERYRDLAITHAMLFCGLRSKEVLELKLGDVDFADAKLRVRGKGGRERALPLPDVLAEALRRYLALERPARGAEPQLFLVLQGRRRGQPMTAAGLRGLFRRRRRRPDLRAANPHRFRHTFGADMTRAGLRLPILQRLMGHADLKTTLGYVRLSLTDVTEEYRRALAQLAQRYGKR